MAAVLIVDDDDIIRDSLYELISEEHKCHTAETADKAIGWLDSEFYDVILTDISMPGLSGVELLSYVRQHHPDTPVIVISGTTDQDNARRLIELGAFDYLLKPFRLETVEESMNRALEERKRLQAKRRAETNTE